MNEWLDDNGSHDALVRRCKAHKDGSHDVSIEMTPRQQASVELCIAAVEAVT